MAGNTTMDPLSEARSARVGLEAALSHSQSSPARAAWRVYHRALAGHDFDTLRDARWILDQAIIHSDDEHLIEAKRRYDSALGAMR